MFRIVRPWQSCSNGGPFLTLSCTEHHLGIPPPSSPKTESHGGGNSANASRDHRSASPRSHSVQASQFPPSSPPPKLTPREFVARSPTTSCRLLQRVGSSRLVKHLDVPVKAIIARMVEPGVAMKYRRSKPHVAATAIQAAYRGHLVRRTQPLKHLRIIRNVRIELQGLDDQLANDPRLFETLSRDPTERLKWSEGGMHLLLQLDSLQGLHPVVRDHRKSLTKDVILYQEYIDSVGKGPHMPYVQSTGQTQPQVPPVYSHQSSYSTPTSAPGVHTYGPSHSHGSSQQGVHPQAHVPYVPTVPGRGERPLSSPPPQSQYAAQPEKTFYPPQGPPRYDYDARFPPGTEPDVIDLFRKADVDGSGAIDTKELQRILSLKFFNFSRRTVRLMLHLFADDTTISSRLGPGAFVQLWRELKKWQRTFKSFDNDGSGTIDLPELREAMLSLGIGVTPQVLQLLVFNYDRTGLNSSIAFGDFIECGLIVKGLTEKFILHDPQYTGAAKIDYQAFMMMVLPFIVA